MAIQTDFSALIPEIQQWNEGRGVPADVWVSYRGSYELAIGYSLMFWPEFVVFEDYVLRSGFDLKSLRSFEGSGDRSSIEKVMNHVHLDSLHTNGMQATEEQMRYLGRILKEIHDVKLGFNFPGRRFEVAFDDKPNKDPLDYTLTFWQI